MSEYDREPLAPHALQPGRSFAASFAGEHVAGTEFVIGALFVAWGVGAADVILGLIIGNTLAVLTWALICAPIATDTRLTLYAYLEKIAGRPFVRLYSLVNGALFCVLGGAMITVSASAIRILLGIPAQVNWYPTSPAFVAVALLVGAVVALAAARGFSLVARFAQISAPWLICAFFIGALALAPTLIAVTPGVDSVNSPADFMMLASTAIWIDQGTDMSIGHVIAISWGANLAFHGALGDMTILRFARKTAYGWYSALGMFIGHSGAWLAAGVMGAGAASLLKTELAQLDAGEVAYQALGAAGILAVVIAGWTTSNPTIYRAGLAFQSINPSWSRGRVTFVTGMITTLIAVFPFVFTKLLGFLGLMALVMAPIGGIIVMEHHFFGRMGLTRWWRLASARAWNVPAFATWIVSLTVAALLHETAGLHLLYLFIPAWLTAAVIYPAFVSLAPITQDDRKVAQDLEAQHAARRRAEQDFMAQRTQREAAPSSFLRSALSFLAIASLLGCFGLGLFAWHTGELAQFKQWLVPATGLYFAASIARALIPSGQGATQDA